MGLIAGASNDDLPNHLVEGLMDQKELKAEIDTFTGIALRGNAI